MAAQKGIKSSIAGSPTGNFQTLEIQMASDTRLLPTRTPRSTGIAQTQIVNRPATMGVGGVAPPVTASPAASRAVQAQAQNASGVPLRPMSARVELRGAPGGSGRTRTGAGNVLPGPPGSAVASVELLPNVTKNPRVPAVPKFSPDELLLLMHLVDKHMGTEISDADRELAEGAQKIIAALLERG